MKLQVVSFELAKKLKEVGYLQECDKQYGNKGTFVKSTIEFIFDRTYAAPTQALAQMWFREKHNIELLISLQYKTPKLYYQVANGINVWKDCKGTSYEKALEAGLLKACELIILEESKDS